MLENRRFSRIKYLRKISRVLGLACTANGLSLALDHTATVVAVQWDPSITDGNDHCS